MQRVIKNINSLKCIIYFVYLTFVNTKLRFFCHIIQSRSRRMCNYLLIRCFLANRVLHEIINTLTGDWLADLFVKFINIICWLRW